LVLGAITSSDIDKNWTLKAKDWILNVKAKNWGPKAKIECKKLKLSKHES